MFKTEDNMQLSIVNEITKDDLLSVIIPTYHRELPIVQRAIDSVINQSYPYIEAIVVDDNESISAFSQKLKSYCKQHGIIYIKQFGRAGACNARNLGVANSTGKYIAFLDDDDEWFPSKASEQIAALKQGFDFVFCNGLNVHVSDITGNRRECKYRSDENFIQMPGFEDMLLKNYVGTTSQIVLTRECFFCIGGFDSQFEARQDYDLCLRASKGHKLYGLNRILFKHYIHSSFQISKDSHAALQGYRRLYVKYKPFYKKSLAAYVNICCKISKSYLHNKKYVLWLMWILKAFFRKPNNLKYILRKSSDPKII